MSLDRLTQRQSFNARKKNFADLQRFRGYKGKPARKRILPGASGECRDVLAVSFHYPRCHSLGSLVEPRISFRKDPLRLDRHKGLRNAFSRRVPVPLHPRRSASVCGLFKPVFKLDRAPIIPGWHRAYVHLRSAHRNKTIKPTSDRPSQPDDVIAGCGHRRSLDPRER